MGEREELGKVDEVRIEEKPIDISTLPAYQKRPVTELVDAKGTAIKIKGKVEVHGEIDSSVPAAIVVEKYTNAEFAKGAGVRKPYEISVDNERE